MINDCRYSAPGLPKKTECKHSTKGLKCNDLQITDIEKFNKMFYESRNKLKQDCFILKFIDIQKPKRRRPRNNTKEGKSYVLKFYITTTNNIKIPVCKKFFMNTLMITKHRIQGVVSRFNNTESMPTERRGGDTRSKASEGKKNSVIEFVKKFKAIEGHYCRSKSSERVYFSSDLNIKKMWRMYQEKYKSDVNMLVKESFFRKTFNSSFNIGFGSPRTDMCSTCIELSEKIKREVNVEKKKTFYDRKTCSCIKGKSFL